MRLNLLLALFAPLAFFAQNNSKVNDAGDYPNAYSNGSANVYPFNNEARKFRDWSVSVGGGGAFLHAADVNSFYDGKVNFGWNGYISLDKQISHTFALSLMGSMGKTNQKALLPGQAGVKAGVGTAWTKYHQISLLGDLNFSNLLRRVDNHSNFKWALHGYAGIGLQGYNTLLLDNDASRWNDVPKRIPIEIQQDLRIDSFFFQFGTGLSYNLSKLVDIEARVMYVATGDDSFDGGGWSSDAKPAYNAITPGHSDNMITANLGLSFKLGKHDTHLRWFDPLQDAYRRTNILENTVVDFVVCEKGDHDNDGVCDDWDRQLDTPAGARVDGAGVALDMDLDGVIDLYDKCVTVPGPVENNGCPPANTYDGSNTATNIEEVNKFFEGIEFELNSAKIRPQSFDKLDQAAEIIKGLDSSTKFAVIGATDARGSAALNQKLSQRRADAVVSYLVKKGVSSQVLTAEGRGKTDLKYPECDPATNCPEWKNEANRRVYFIQK